MLRHVCAHITLTTFGRSGLQFRCKKQLSRQLEARSLPRVKTIDWLLDGKTEQVQLKKTDFEKLGRSSLKALSGNWGQSGLSCMEPDDWLSSEYSNKCRKRPNDTLKEKIKTIVLHWHKFEKRDESQLKLFLALSNYQDSKQETKSIVFSSYAFPKN